MHLGNWAFPDWNVVDCTKRQQKIALCVINYSAKREMYDALQNNISCQKGQFIVSRFCLQFICPDLTGKELMHTINKNTLLYPDVKYYLRKMMFLFSAVAVPFPPIISACKANPSEIVQLRTHQYSGILNNIYNKGLLLDNWAKRTFLTSDYTTNLGVFLAKFNATSDFVVQFGNIFLCIVTKVYISTLFLFDDNNDCGHNDLTDELARTCKGKQCRTVHSKTTECSSLFFKNNSNHCVSAPHDVLDNTHNLSNKYSKFSPEDLLIYCAPKHGHFRLSDICVYMVNHAGIIIPCRSGSHMESCEHFTCNKKFKCPGYYCIPHGYVCDNKWDCPYGADEEMNMCNNTARCEYMFKCRFSVICVHSDDVCNRQNDCPLGDDEILCILWLVQCPSFCQCMNFVISCSDNRFTSSHLKYKLPHLSFTIRNNSQVDSTGILDTFPGLLFAYFYGNKIRSTCSAKVSISTLKYFDAWHNNISKVESNCFGIYPNIKNVLLQANNIHLLDKMAFSNLFFLQNIDLSTNNINHLMPTIFYGLPNLRKLSLQCNPLQHIHRFIFVNLVLNVIETENYRICCNKPPDAECNAAKPWYASCENILPKISMFMTASVVTGVVLLTNICSMIWEIMHLSNGQAVPYSMIVLSINVSDFLCAVYFLILLSGHTYYIGTYVLGEKYWICGYTCHTAFALSFLFSLVSPTLLTLFSFSRFSVVKYPFDSTFKHSSFVGKLLVSLWVTCIGSSIVIAMVQKLVYQKVAGSLCWYTADPASRNMLVTALTFILSTFHLLSLILISLFHAKLIISLKKRTTKAQGNNQTKKHISKSTICQLALILLSNLLSWIPPSIIFVTCVFLAKYPPHLFIWTVIVATPINSITNPVIFIVLNIRGHMEEKRKRMTKEALQQNLMSGEIKSNIR